METSGKVWGKTQLIYRNHNFEIHRIEALKDGYCSIHKHDHKANVFFIESGKLKIRVWKNDYDLVDETILHPGEKTTVKPGEFHQFIALEDCVCYEIYYVELDGADIVRKNHGGKSFEKESTNQDQ